MTELDLDELATALACFQAEMPIVTKTRTAKVSMKGGGSYSYTYADLADVTAQSAPILAKYGLAFATYPQQTESGAVLVGMLLHKSGQHLEGSLPIRGNTPQELGGWLTYGRRYLLGCLTGIVTEDDVDGSPSQPRTPATQSGVSPTRKMGRAPKADEGVSDAQLKKMGATMREAGLTERANALAYVASVIGRDVDSRNDLTAAEASSVIDRLERDLQPPPDPSDGDDPWSKP